MKIMVVDRSKPGGVALAQGLNKTLGNRALYASSLAEAMSHLHKELDSIGVIVFTLDANPEVGLSFIRSVKEFCEVAVIRRPSFVVLSPIQFSSAYHLKFRVMGAECLLHGFVDQVYVAVRNLISVMTREDGMPTFHVLRSEGHPSFHLLGRTHSKEMNFGPRLLRVVNHFAVYRNHWLSTMRVAEAADISLASVRVYLDRIRAVYDETRKRVGVDIPGSDVFWTGRKDGAYVHVLKARVLFE